MKSRYDDSRNLDDDLGKLDKIFGVENTGPVEDPQMHDRFKPGIIFSELERAERFIAQASVLLARRWNQSHPVAAPKEARSFLTYGSSKSYGANVYGVIPQGPEEMEKAVVDMMEKDFKRYQDLFVEVTTKDVIHHPNLAVPVTVHNPTDFYAPFFSAANPKQAAEIAKTAHEFMMTNLQDKGAEAYAPLIVFEGNDVHISRDVPPALAEELHGKLTRNNWVRERLGLSQPEGSQREK